MVRMISRTEAALWGRQLLIKNHEIENLFYFTYMMKG